jgi:NAD-dependent dihydropyrimidine dehydrogenase PreA subunit
MSPPAAVDCKHEAGVLQPVVNRNKCEGKDDCVAVCPYSVFVVRVLTPEEKAGLGTFARFKAFAHGNRQAFAVRAEDCHACGQCVSACPEKAITLQRR